MQKLTHEEVLTQFQREYPEAPATPEALKRMRGTMLKRAERLRKKNAVGMAAAFAPRTDSMPVVSIAPLPEVQLTNVEAPLPPAVQALAEMVNPVPDTQVVALGTSTGFPEPEIDGAADDTDANRVDALRDAEEEIAFPGAMTEEEKTECRLDQQDDAAKESAPVKRRYTMVPVLSGGQPLADVVVDAISEKEANKLTWAGLSDPQKDNCEYIDCVDVKDIPTATKQVLVIGHGTSAAIATAAIKAAEAQPGTFISLLDAKPISLPSLAAKYMGQKLVHAGLDLASPDAVDQSETILSDAQPTKEGTVKKLKKSAKVGKRTPREEIVKSAAFIALFEKAIAKSRDPKRTHCKNGHTITAAHAHVGDMKRTGRYTCDPCNQDAQAKYNGGK